MGDREAIASAPAYWRRNQAAVTIAVFIGFTGFTLVMPFLPLYLEQLGVRDPAENAIWSGFALGVTPAITALMAPLWARLADRFGRKMMVARSLLSFVIIMAAMALVRHPWQVLVLRAIQGLFAGYGPLAMMMAAESSPPDQMATSIGWVQTAQRLGPALGPVVGGVLAGTIGLRETFFAAAGIYVVGFLIVLVGFREDPAARERERQRVQRPVTFRALQQVPHFALFLSVVFSLQLVDRSFGPILPLYLGEIGTPAARVAFASGLLFTVSAAFAAIGNYATAKLIARWPTSRLVPAGALLATGSAIVFGHGASLSTLLLVAALFGFGIGLATTATYTAAGQAVDAPGRGAAFGYLSTAYLLGLAVSPVVAGFIGAVSMRTVFFVDAIGLVATAAVISWRMAGGRARESAVLG